jgi:hypothetical protein
MIARRDHEGEAIRMRDNLRKKLDELGAKIKRNLN